MCFQLGYFCHFLLQFDQYLPIQNLVKSMTLHKSVVHGVTGCYLYYHPINTGVVTTGDVLVVSLVTVFQVQ